MPPVKKRTSPEPNATGEDEPQTPSGSPPQKRARITQKQKQALIDNLQLEITERARKLRAHYALQAQDLRSRVERRVNRIPVSLRKQTMGELLAKHAESQTESAENHSEASRKPATKSATRKASAPNGGKKAASAVGKAKKTAKGGKRKSDELQSSDKENAPAASEDANPPLSNPKKRTKPNPAAGQSRAVSQLAASEVTDGRVLSPKSSNSRTFPHSPLKSPSKTQHQQYNSHQPSPLKPASPAKAAANRTANSQKTNAQENVAPSAKGKKVPSHSTVSATSAPTFGSPRKAPPSRPATRTHNRQASTSTTTSNTSNGTTVKSTRANTTTRKATQPNSTSTASSHTTTTAATSKKQSVPRGLASTASSAAKKVSGAAKKQSGVQPPAPGRRVLRSRG